MHISYISKNAEFFRKIILKQTISLKNSALIHPRTNLSKFAGVQLLGGVEMNGAEIYSQAQQDIERLEEQIQLAYELPPEYMMG